jgi:hypothetical protein
MIVKGRNVHVNMQRRQLELIADVVSDIPDEDQRGLMAVMFGERLKRERVNDNFDLSRFVKACMQQESN